MVNGNFTNGEDKVCFCTMTNWRNVYNSKLIACKWFLRSDFRFRDLELGKVSILIRGQWSRQQSHWLRADKIGVITHSSLVLTLDVVIPSGHAHRHASFTFLRRISHTQTSVNMHFRWRHAWQAQILDVIRQVLLLQHPSDLDEVIIPKNVIYRHLRWDILLGIYWIE